jgi:hypothetical protein
MYVNRLSNFFTSLKEKMKALLLNKNALIFLFFAVVATIFWFVVVLDKMYETRVSIPITYINVPVDVQIVNELPSHLDVKIRDKGISLLVYRQKNYFDPLVFDFSKHSFIRNILSVHANATFEKVISKKLLSTSVIEDYFPRTFEFERAKLNQKRVPVKLIHDISCRKQYNLSGPIVMEPSEVIIYGSKERIDTIQYVTTETIILNDLKDTTKIDVRVNALPYTRLLPEKISVSIPVEIFTESSISVPITVKNLPENVIVRIIPSEVDIMYQVGKSMFNKVQASDFVLSVDYQNVVKSTSRRQFLVLDTYPDYLKNVKVSRMEIDCLIEIKD